MEKLYFEDCQVGDRILAPARTITETDLVQFAALTGDWHPVHTDAEYAKGSIFGERIAHGMLVLSIGSGLLFRAQTNAALPKFSIAAAGLNNVRFVAPTKIGDTLHLEGEVTQVRTMDKERGLITARHRVMNQRGEVVLTFITKTLAWRRPRREGTMHG